MIVNATAMHSCVLCGSRWSTRYAPIGAPKACAIKQARSCHTQLMYICSDMLLISGLFSVAMTKENCLMHAAGQ